MDILGDKFSGVVVVVVALLILYVIGRLIFSFISRAREAGRSFDTEVNENRDRPMSGSESIGSISMRLGEDVRDVWMMGYSDNQINGVLTGKYSLGELYKMQPEGNERTPKGQEVLAGK